MRTLGQLTKANEADDHTLLRRGVLLDVHGFAIREWQKMRERNEALDCYVYARAAAAVSGLDRFEDRHWRELERQIGLSPPGDPDSQIEQPIEATQRGGLAVSGTRISGRRLIRSRWLT